MEEKPLEKKDFVLISEVKPNGKEIEIEKVYLNKQNEEQVQV